MKPGGTIVCAAECRDGFPDHGSFREELTALASPQLLLDAIAAREQTVPDQWHVQVQASIQSSARVVMHTSYLSDDDLAAAHLEQARDIGAFVEEALAAAGPASQVCVLPEGPQTIPYVALATASRSAAVAPRQREQREELRHQEPGREPEHRVERAGRVAHRAEQEGRRGADRVAEPEHHRHERADPLRRPLEVERERHHEREQATLGDAGEQRACVGDRPGTPRARRRPVMKQRLRPSRNGLRRPVRSEAYGIRNEAGIAVRFIIASSRPALRSLQPCSAYASGSQALRP